jgi:hypothetical protein
MSHLISTLRAAGGTAVLCAHCHADIPTVGGVGLTLFAAPGRRVVIGSSGALIDQVEDLQITLDEGPCVDAAAARTPVLVDDLAGGSAVRQWPQFAVQASRCGVKAMFAFPVIVDGRPVAVLDLCRARPGPLSDHDRDRAHAYAGAAAVMLADDMRPGTSTGAAVSLDVARVQQATGMVMGQATTDAVTALHQLRTHALRRSVPLATVVDQVLAGSLRFDPDPTP